MKNKTDFVLTVLEIVIVGLTLGLFASKHIEFGSWVHGTVIGVIATRRLK